MTELFFFRLIGALGLLFIIAGVLVKNDKHQNILFIIGGICLEVYSIYIQDVIFIVLQLIFILSATYALFRITQKETKAEPQSGASH